jgi:hypothetical protein
MMRDFWLDIPGLFPARHLVVLVSMSMQSLARSTHPPAVVSFLKRQVWEAAGGFDETVSHGWLLLIGAYAGGLVIDRLTSIPDYTIS